MDIGGVSPPQDAPHRKHVEDRIIDAEDGKLSSRADADPADAVSANPDDRVEPGVKAENDVPSPDGRGRPSNSDSALDVIV